MTGVTKIGMLAPVSKSSLGVSRSEADNRPNVWSIVAPTSPGDSMKHRLLWLSATALTACLTPPSLDEETTVTDPVRPAAAPQTWRTLTTPVPPAATGFGAPLLYQDGTVWVQEYGKENWWRLTPDNTGDYANGTLTQMPSMPAGYSPLYNCSAVLPDGHIIIEGGEYLALGQAFTNRGAIYDPVANHWTAVQPPANMPRIGDASCMVLPDRTFLLSDCCDTGAPMATLDLATMQWTPVGSGKQSIHDEESWTLLPDGTILLSDAINTAKPTESEIYDPATGKWTSAGSTVVALTDPGSFEQGPLMLRPDGIAFAIGGTSHTAKYDTHTKTWSAGPDLPMANAAQLQVADGPGAMLPNGKMLIASSPGVFAQPTHFHEFDGTTFTAVPDTVNAMTVSSYQNFMVMLPTGEVLMTDNSDKLNIYTPSAGVMAEAVPVITSAPRLISAGDPDPILPERIAVTSYASEPEQILAPELLPLVTMHPGRQYKLGGVQLNGLSLGAYYGDDQQSATNYPMIRVTTMGTSHVRYYRAHDSSNYSIAPGNESTTKVDVPMDAELGLATLEVVANGVPSPPIVVNIK
jgi:hypothetical protein